MARMGRMERIGWAALALAALTALAAAGCADARADVPDAELRAQALNQTLMCPICPGESIDQSQNALAAQMRGIVDEKIAEGWSDADIRGFFVERYGPAVLLEPPREGIGLAAWLLPPIAVALAAAAWVVALRRMRRAAPAPYSVDPAPQGDGSGVSSMDNQRGNAVYDAGGVDDGSPRGGDNQRGDEGDDWRGAGGDDASDSDSDSELQPYYARIEAALGGEPRDEDER